MKKNLMKILFALFVIHLLMGCENPLGDQSNVDEGFSMPDSGDNNGGSNPPPTNTAPTISDVSDQTINMNTSSAALAFTINDSEDSLNCVTSVSITSSNASLIDNTDVAFSGTAPNCTLVLTPNSFEFGNATLTLAVTDGVAMAQDNIDLQVNFTPQNISSLQVWFDANDSSTLFSDDSCSVAAGDGSEVACWTDKSTNGNNAIQSTTGNTPTFDVSSSSVVFDGSDDFLNITSDTGFPYGASQRTLFVLTQTSTTAPGFKFSFSYGSPSLGQSYFWGINGSNCFYGGFGVDITTPGCAIATQWMFTTGIYNGTAGSIRYNGLLESSQTQAWNTTAGNAYIGRQTNDVEYWNGNIKEILLFDEELSSELIENIEGYLACKHDIRDLLDTGHPYYNAIGSDNSGCP